MKTIKWLLSLADGKPLIFSIAIMLIAILVLAYVVMDRDVKLSTCVYEQRIAKAGEDRRIDSINNYYRLREIQLNNEIQIILINIIETQNNQLNEQKAIDNKISNVRATVRSNSNKLKTLKNEN